MPQLPEAIRKSLQREQIKVCAFMGIKRQGEPPFFMAAIWPAEERDHGAILDKSKFYATAEADSPEECARIMRDKLYEGL